MTPAEFTALGRTLYGQRWKTDLARELGRHRMTVWKWAKGEKDLPEHVARHVELLAESKARQLTPASAEQPRKDK